MKIKVLSENTSLLEGIEAEHGLSLYVEVGKHKILFDVGVGNLFARNAEKMNVDISQVDGLILSHGHYDHGGGIETFLDLNRKAPVFLRKEAFQGYYSISENGLKKYIGLNKTLEGRERIRAITEDVFEIGEGIILLSNIDKRKANPESNRNLFIEKNGELVRDDFIHEQVLVVKEDGKTLLITGCAHSGIVNILEQCVQVTGCRPDYVAGGFHLTSRPGDIERAESFQTIDDIGRYLLEAGGQYYTCHCTGTEPYERLRKTMGNNIEYISAGQELIL